MAPAAFGDMSNASPLARNEVFGSVLATSRFYDEQTAIELANDTAYVLAAYLHASDIFRVPIGLPLASMPAT